MQCYTSTGGGIERKSARGSALIGRPVQFSSPEKRMRWWNGSGGVQLIQKSLTRHFSRERAENVKRINPKVPFPEAISISQSLYKIINQNGPLSVSSTWIHAKDANISGLKSKTHMKIMLKWMRGKNLLKLFCTRVGSNKKFLHSTLPESKDKLQPSLNEGKKQI